MITMMGSITNIYFTNTGLIKKSVASVTKVKLSVRDTRRAKILAMMKPGVFVTSVTAAKKNKVGSLYLQRGFKLLA